MQVTSDKYELPVIIADSSLKLARMCGISNVNICRSVQRTRSSKHQQSLEEIGRPALVAKGLTDKTPLEVGKEFDLYNWDDLASLIQGHTMDSNNMFDTDSIDSVGKIHIVEDKFVWINGDVED